MHQVEESSDKRIRAVSKKNTQLPDQVTGVFVYEEIQADEPSRNICGELFFSDFPDFKPNMTPKEILQAGGFSSKDYIAEFQ